MSARGIVLDHAGQRSLGSLPGIGPRVAEKLAARGLHTLQDLWLLLPRSYQDRTTLTPIRALQAGVPAQVEGRIAAVERGFRYRPVLRVALVDDGGGTLVLRFFHFRAQQAAQFRPGGRLRAFGTPRPGAHGLEIAHPSYRLLGDAEDAPLGDTLEPVYPAVEGIGPQTLAKWVAQAVALLPDDDTLELLPADVLRDLRLPSLRSALATLHRPPRDVDAALLAAGRHPAQRRMAFEELLAHQLSLRRQRLQWRAQSAAALRRTQVAKQLQAALPFTLTEAQRRVFAEVAADMAKPTPMLRLVQGDVGSGKTAVAALAAAIAVGSGKQVALMAPTELLGEQHARTLRMWLEPLGISVAWLAGKITGKARTQVLQAIAVGQAQVVVGTHALMQSGVAFHSLALVIIDEQHRFGVQQRLALREKGEEGERLPHQLVMTATPIPRTLAMSAYADLDLSVIDALPPGRTPVTTVAIDAARREELIARIRHACGAGRQAYWVCTLIETPDDDAASQAPKVEAQAAQDTFDALRDALPELRVGLVHGRLKAAEKQAAMQAFQRGEIDVLVATTVIEVGVDVPNASLIVIENAERLGLSQLHQLRGRVGRGSAQSSCVLLYRAPLSAMARQRLDTLRQTNDGFLIAEKDLQLRGPGELLGTRQTGELGFRIADLARDVDLLPAVQRIAERLLAEDPALADRLVQRWIGASARYAGA